MYFSSNASGSFQLWRQQYPKGTPQQVTVGPTEAEGIAIAREMLTQVRGTVNGVQVSAPFGKVDLALQVFEATA